jgi:MFS family permease
MRARVARPARIAALWFGVQAVWSAVLGVFLQSRVSALAPHSALATYGWIAASGAIVAATVQVGVGFWSDRRLSVRGHRRDFYLAGVVVACVALVGFFAAPSVLTLLAAFLALEVGVNVASGPYQAAIPDAIAPEATGRASAWMSTSSFAGSVTGLIVAATLDGALAAAALLVALTGGTAITLAHLRGLPPVSARPAPFRLTRDVAMLLLSRGAINVGFYTLFGFLFFFVRESLHATDVRATTGVLFLVFTIAGVGGAALAGRAADRYDKRAVVGVSAAVIAVAVIVFAAAANDAIAYAAAAASGAAWGAFFTADWAIAFALLPRGAMAAAMGVWNLAAAIPQIVAPAVTAPLVSALDARTAGLGPRVALALVALEFVTGAALVWCIPRASLDPDATRTTRVCPGSSSG